MTTRQAAWRAAPARTAMIGLDGRRVSCRRDVIGRPVGIVAPFPVDYLI